MVVVVAGRDQLSSSIHGAGARSRSPSLPPCRVPPMSHPRVFVRGLSQRRRGSSKASSEASSSASSPSSLRQPIRFLPSHGSWVCLRKCLEQRTEFDPGARVVGTWKNGPKELPLCIDIYDEIGIGGGASGVAGGLIHPYSPKGKLIWRGAEFWRECLKMLSVAERAGTGGPANSYREQIAWRRGIVRLATTMKNAETLKKNAQSCLDICCIELLDQDAAQKLLPDLCVPFNSAIYMPQAVNIHPKRYLQALFLACKNLADDFSASGSGRREINLFKKSIGSLHELPGNYRGVIICLGAKAKLLPELSGMLPLRMCRGVVAHMKLADEIRGVHETWSPSVLSDAWLAFQGPHSAIMGSTWEWGSMDYSSSVSPEEGSRAFEELLPKASAVYPAIKKWSFVGSSGGLRAMPPLTELGSLPLLGRVDAAVGEKAGSSYWLVGGLGARGLLYHGLLGKLISQAVISCNEDILPSELTSWKKVEFMKERG